MQHNYFSTVTKLDMRKLLRTHNNMKVLDNYQGANSLKCKSIYGLLYKQAGDSFNTKVKNPRFISKQKQLELDLHRACIAHICLVANILYTQVVATRIVITERPERVGMYLDICKLLGNVYKDNSKNLYRVFNDFYDYSEDFEILLAEKDSLEVQALLKCYTNVDNIALALEDWETLLSTNSIYNECLESLSGKVEEKRQLKDNEELNKKLVLENKKMLLKQDIEFQRKIISGE